MDRRPQPGHPHIVESDHTLAQHAQNVQMPGIPTMIRQMFRESQGLSNDDWRVSHSHTSFIDDILYVEPSRRFRMPTLHVYEGSSNPNQYILKYEWPLNTAQADDAVKGRSFSISLWVLRPCGLLAYHPDPFHALTS